MELPYLTGDLAGVGGTLRARPEDFVVDEVPAYLPSGAGDHVFARIEKRDHTTPHAVAQIAAALGVAARDIGTAGMKDRRAVTTQWISLPPPVTPEAASALGLEGIRVLEVARHAHKLRTGHVRANRFRLRVRGVGVDAAELARAILARLAESPGAPNWYGEQRFGRARDNAAHGRALLLGERRTGRDRSRDRFLVSALQAELFNAWLAARIADGLYRAALAGDVMHKRPRDGAPGGMFDCADPAAETARIAAGEIVPTGPMFGERMRRPADGTPAAAREDAILEAAQLPREAWSRVRQLAEGTRRDAAIAIADREVTVDEPGTVDVAFTLPSGAYATTVMREVMKSAPGEPEDSAERTE